MGEKLDSFNRFRSEMNDRILEEDNLVVRRFFNIDTRAYEPGALSPKVKEMMGLVASMVLRCDDCITYHIIQCRREGVTRDEFFELFSVSLVVGGSIVIPHMRRAVAMLDEMESETDESRQ
jgi:AhpD family alkylhydroperoxidase